MPKALKIATTINFSKVANMLLSIFVFILLVDPSNKIFGLKVILFAALVAMLVVSRPRINKLILVPIISILVIAFSSSLGLMGSYNTDYAFLTFFLQGFLVLFILPWVGELKIMERCVTPAIVITAIVILLQLLFFVIPSSLTVIAYKMLTTAYKGTVMVSRRFFLGIQLNTVYYTSAPVLLIIFSYYFSRFIFSLTQKKKNLLISAILFIPLMCGGTRAMMLSVIVIMYVCYVVKFWRDKRRIISILLVIAGVFGFIGLLVILLSDKGEQSLDVKITLLKAFMNHIEEYPQTLLLGNGVGATFDSLGVRGVDAIQSEWTYLELIRWFGIPLALLFFSVYLYPIFRIIKMRRFNPIAISVTIGYIMYLFLAGTNPYLYSSNGMLALLLMYNYTYNPHYEKREIE